MADGTAAAKLDQVRAGSRRAAEAA
jgi:hypothetical protein